MITRIVAMAGSVAAMLACLAAVDAAAAAQKLRMALLQPAGSAEYQSAVIFKRAVEAAASGALHIELHPRAALYAPLEGVKALTTGAAEIGTLALDDLAADLPATSLFVQPFMFHDQRVLEGAWRRGSPVRRPIEAALLASRGLRTLWWHPNGVGVIVSKGRPMTRAEDVAGASIWSPGYTLSRWIEACRAKPLQNADDGLPAQVEPGKVDGIMTHLLAVPARRMWQGADTLSLTRHYVGGLIFVMPDRVWQGLSPAVRDAVKTVAADLDAAGLAGMAEAERGAIEAAAANGMSIEMTRKEDLTAWKLCAAAVTERFADEAGALGEEVIAGYRQVLNDVATRP